MGDKIVHLTDEEIKNYLASDPSLSGSDLRRIYRHLEQCDDCCAR